MNIRTGLEIAVVLALCVALFFAHSEANEQRLLVAARDATIEKQNNDIELAKASAATANANAQAAALRTLARSRATRERIAAGSGHEEMNQWFLELAP